MFRLFLWFLLMSTRPCSGGSSTIDAFRLGPTIFARRAMKVTHTRRFLQNVTCRATSSDLTIDTFTPTRDYPTRSDDITMALVMAVSTIGEDPPLRLLQQFLQPRWPSWAKRFLPYNRYLLLVLIVEHNPIIGMKDITKLLNLTKPPKGKIHGQGRSAHILRSLDAGYEVFTSVDKPGEFYVLISIMKFPLPKWLHDAVKSGNTTLEKVARTWRSEFWPSPYQYIAMNTWYSYPGLLLDILDYFDYWLKIDCDVFWLKSITEDMRKIFFDARALFIHSEINEDPYEISRGVDTARNEYLLKEQSRCGAMVYPRALGQPFFENTRNVFYGNFIGGWLGFLTSPEVTAFGKLWKSSTMLWKHRWGDQQFWCQALGLFHNGSRLLNLSSWRNRLFLHSKGPPPAM